MKQVKYLILILLLFPVLTAFAEEAKEKLVVAKIDADGVQRVDVVGGSYYFDPNHIVVKVGVPVELKFTKEPGLIPHNVIIKAPEVGIDFSEGMTVKPKVVKFTPTKTGKYEMICDKKFLFLKNHKEKGMKGMLEVVE